MISLDKSVFVTVLSHPRMEMNILKDLIQYNRITCFDGGGIKVGASNSHTTPCQLKNKIDLLSKKRCLPSAEESQRSSTIKSLPFKDQPGSSSSFKPKPITQTPNDLSSSVRCMYFGHDYSKQIESIYDRIQSHSMKFSKEEITYEGSMHLNSITPPLVCSSKNAFTSVNDVNEFDVKLSPVDNYHDSNIHNSKQTGAFSGQCLTDLIKQINIKEKAAKKYIDVSNANYKERTTVDSNHFDKDSDFDLDSTIDSHVQHYVEVTTSQASEDALSKKYSGKEVCFKSKFLQIRTNKTKFSGSMCVLCDFQSVDCVHGTPPKKAKLDEKDEQLHNEWPNAEGKFRSRTKSTSPNFPRIKKVSKFVIICLFVSE